ncbi:MAG: phage portal protein [Candidatus Thorarchaeota archaeon]
MARKRKKKTPSKQLVNVDSTLKKLQTQLVDPQVQSWLWHGAQGVRERILQLNFRTLRNLSQRLPLINAIINTRADQVLPFCHYAVEKGDKGFLFEVEDRTQEFKKAKPNDDEIMQISTFMEQTGFAFDPEREDDFADYVSMIVRDVYEIDQIATEIQRNRLGEVAAFWGLDGATVMRVIDTKRFARGVRFVQMIEDKIYNEFKVEDLVFDYRYKRSDIKYRGYGYSPVEQTIDVITTLLFGYNYIRDQLMKDKVPKGFIAVMGDASKPQLDQIRNYWYAAMSGAGGQWAIPILPSGKDGVGLEFKTLSQSNKDMEYHKTIMFVSSLVAAVFSIDLAEMGIKTDDSTSLIGENLEPRIQHSKDRGLGSMLSFVSQHVNKILRKVTQKYRFKFVGLEREDEEKKAKVRSKQLATHRTINELREEDELEPFDEDWAEMPLHPQAVQIYLDSKSAERAKEMQEQGMGMPFGENGQGGQPPDGQQTAGEEGQSQGRAKTGDELFTAEKQRVRKSLEDFRKSTDEKERRVHIVVE